MISLAKKILPVATSAAKFATSTAKFSEEQKKHPI